MSLGNLDLSARKTLASAGPYPIEAYAFVRDGLGHTVRRVLAAESGSGLPGARAGADEDGRDSGDRSNDHSGDHSGSGPQRRHVNGQQLCMGLREFAIEQFGVMAPAVFAHWNVHRTDDFGRMVFAMIDAGMMSKTDDDSLDDFRGVFDFDEAFSRDALYAGIGVRDPGPRAASRAM